MSAERRGPDREPWAIRFGALQTYLGCLLAAALFAALLWLWLRVVVPDDTVGGNEARITAAFGTAATILLLLVGPLLAFLLGLALRRSRSTAVHVIAFTFAGSVLGGVVGVFLGPELVVTLVPTLGLASGLARLLMAPAGRRSRPSGG